MSQYQRRRRRRRWWRYYPYNFIIAIATLLVILALVITACVSRCNSADAVDHTEETADLTVQPIYGTGWETNPPTAETTPEPSTEPWMPDETDVEYIAKTVYGEALIVKSDTRRAAVVWCILNRVDAKGYPDTIEGVVTAPYQFSGYDPDHPVTEELRDLTIDVLQRWNAEKNGETDVGRVLPKGYCFFVGDGFENYFTDEWKGTDYWDWSLPSPYEN